MKLIPILEHLHENEQFAKNADCVESLDMCVNFYKKVGFHVPWICYFIQVDNELVGGGAFKGKPLNGKVEIAYMTFEQHRQKAIATQVANHLVQLALETDPAVRVTALTLREENYSTKILRKNNFTWIGDTTDDGEEVWEWEYRL